MSQSTPAIPSLGTLFVARIEPVCLAATRQRRVGRRLVLLSLGLLLASGRTMLSRVLLVLGLSDQDWSAAYRLFTGRRLDLEVLRRDVVARWLALLGSRAPLVTVLDSTQLPRTGKKMPGTGFLRAPRTPAWRPGIHHAQRWEGLSGLTRPSPDGDCRATPLWFEPAPSPSARPWPGVAPRTEAEAGVAAVRWLRTVLDELGAKSRRLIVVADGAYSGAPVWKALPQGVTLLARCAKNRALFAMPHPPAGERGRHRKYGERGPTPQAFWQQRTGWTALTVRVRGRDRHLRVQVTGPWLVKPAPECPLFLLVVGGSHRPTDRYRREPLAFLVSARKTPKGAWVLPESVTDLVGWAWQRWEVEVMHRELKSGFGLGDQQQWHPVSAALVIPWVVWTYAMLVLAAHETWGTSPPPAASRWYRGRRWTPREALSAVRQEVWTGQLLALGPVPTVMATIPGKNAAAPAGWPAWLRTLHAL
jgi:hypothetical protein